jgi:mono/diheme cytochrome c family protein
MRFGLSTFLLVVLCGTTVAQERGDPQAGRVLAEQVCKACHAIERGATRSPVPDAPSFGRIANSPDISELALRVLLQSSHPTMPDLMFEPAELRNVIAYISTLKEQQ